MFKKGVSLNFRVKMGQIGRLTGGNPVEMIHLPVNRTTVRGIQLKFLGICSGMRVALELIKVPLLWPILLLQEMASVLLGLHPSTLLNYILSV